jgi:glycerol-3-phosphate dehydrogenase
MSDNQKNSSFSKETRQQNLIEMASQPVDVRVIGAGITGAGIARDAAMRGLRTALIDQADFASGTSSKSSRLVHGGLRYLEMGDLRLVFEASAERKTLLRIAPHLVRPRSFIFPIFKESRVPKWKLAIGLWAYDMLSLFRNVQRHVMLGKHQVEEAEPALKRKGLVGGARYYDAQCDDARLTLANVISAHENGAIVTNYTKAVGFIKSGKLVIGARVRDELESTEWSVEARVVINATGPWSDDTRADGLDMLRPTKGTHILVDRKRLGNNEAITLTSAVDGRVMFVIPWGKLTYIGTTDTDDDSDPGSVQADSADVDYLLTSANEAFPNARLVPDDVISAWAGFRPLLKPDDPLDPSSVSREHRIIRGADGLISIVGGKLTTYRKMAAEVVDSALREVQFAGRKVPDKAETDTEVLPGGDGACDEAFKSRLTAFGVSNETARHLWFSYGTRALDVLESSKDNPHLLNPIVVGYHSICAELVHACRQEMGLTLCDILIRRSHLFYEVVGHGVEDAPELAKTIGGELGWSEAETTAQLQAYLTEVDDMTGFRAPA